MKRSVTVSSGFVRAVGRFGPRPANYNGQGSPTTLASKPAAREHTIARS